MLVESVPRNRGNQHRSDLPQDHDKRKGAMNPVDTQSLLTPAPLTQPRRSRLPHSQPPVVQSTPYQPFFDGVAQMFDPATLPVRPFTQETPQTSQVSNRHAGSIGFISVPFFGPNGKVAEYPTQQPTIPPSPPCRSATASDAGAVPALIHRQLRCCGGMGCRVIFPSQYPHQQCQHCGLNNVPRWAELKGIPASAQISPLVKTHPICPQPGGATGGSRCVKPIPTSVVAAQPANTANRKKQGPLFIIPTPLDALLAETSRLDDNGGLGDDEDMDVDFGSDELAYPEQSECDICDIPSLSISTSASHTAQHPLSMTIIDRTPPRTPTGPIGRASCDDIPLLPLPSKLKKVSPPEPLSLQIPSVVTRVTASTLPRPCPLPLRSTGPKPLSMAILHSTSPRTAFRGVEHASLNPVPSIPPATKWRKVFHHEPSSVKAPLPSRPAPIPEPPSNPIKVKSSAASNPQTCSTTGGSNVIDRFNSVGTGRCSDCVIRDWKTKKVRAVDQASQKKLRTVSWADDLVDNDEASSRKDVEATSVTYRQPEQKPTGLKIKLNLSKIRHLTNSPVSAPARDSSKNDENESDWDSSSSGDQESDPDSSSSEDIQLNVLRRTALKIRIPSRTSYGPSSVPPPPTASASPPNSTPTSTPPLMEQSPAYSRTSTSASPQPNDVLDAQLPPTSLANGERRCVNFSRCRQVLQWEYHWKSSPLCRGKSRHYRRKHQNLHGSHKGLEEELSHFKETQLLTQTVPKRLKPRPLVMPYPEYKCLDSLLENLKKLSEDFFQAQARHQAYKNLGDMIVSTTSASNSDSNKPKNTAEAKQSASPTATSPASPTENIPISVFCFDGEFTIAVPDFDIILRKPAIDKMVTQIRDEAQRSTRVSIGHRRWVSLFDHGIVTRFVCARECLLFGPPKVPGGPPQEMAKLMQGELEVAVVVDRTHPFFAGQRTVVRLRLIG